MPLEPSETKNPASFYLISCLVGLYLRVFVRPYVCIPSGRLDGTIVSLGRRQEAGHAEETNFGEFCVLGGHVEEKACGCQ